MLGFKTHKKKNIFNKAKSRGDLQMRFIPTSTGGSKVLRNSKAEPQTGILRKRVKGNPRLDEIKKRRRILFRQQLKELYIRNRFKLGIFFVLSLIFLAGFVVFIVIRSFGNTKISQIIVIGETEHINNQIKDQLSIYSSKSLFDISIESLRSDISKAYNLSGKQIKLYKIIPDTLKIEIVENSPKLAAINFFGIYLVDNYGALIKQLDVSATPVTQSEREFLSLTKNLDSEMVKAEYLSINNLPTGFVIKWDEVEVDKKEEAYNHLVERISLKQEEFYRIATEEVSKGDYKYLPLIKSYFELFSEGDFIDNDLIDLTLYFAEELGKLGIISTEKLWPSAGSIVIKSESQKEFWFSKRRDKDQQLIDLQTMVYGGRLNEGSIFDFRSNNFSIR